VVSATSGPAPRTLIAAVVPAFVPAFVLSLGALAAGCGPDWRLPLLVEPEPASGDRNGAAPLRVLEGTSVWTGELPIRAAACQPACADLDGDGLSDVWEQALLHAVRPTLQFHRDDGMFFDPRAALAMIGRVTPWDDTILVILVITYGRDYGRCGGDDHPGDLERIALELRPLADGRSARADRWYIAAHEGTSYDASRYGTFPAQPPIGPLRAMRWSLDAPPDSLLVARDKHATYPSLAACAGRRVPCVDDLCSVDQPIDLLPWNAGEPTAPLLEDLDDLGFPGQCVWCPRVFCGDAPGAPAASCVPPLLEKLEHSPFQLPGR
jgi:hypothetical protein